MPHLARRFTKSTEFLKKIKNWILIFKNNC